MIKKRVWFLPDLGLLEYPKRYPLVAFFSLVCAIPWPFKFSDVFQTSLYFTLPLSILVQLGLGLPWFKKGRFTLFSFPLTLGVWLFFLFHYDADPALETSALQWEWFWTMALAGVLFPLVGMRGDTRKKWDYLLRILVHAAGAGLMFGFLVMVGSVIISHLPHVGFDRSMEDMWSTLLICALFPWYAMAALGKPTPLANPLEWEEGTFRKFFYMSILAVGVFACFSLMDLLKWFRNSTLVSSPWESIQGCALLALFSFLLIVPLVLKREGGWLGPYRRMVSGILLLMLLGAAIAQARSLTGKPWDRDDYFSLWQDLWLGGTFLYFLLRAKARWNGPLFGGLLLLVASLVGPFQLREMSFRDHKAYLEGRLRMAGMFLEGHVVKPPADPDKKLFAEITAEFSYIARYDGLLRLQGWFTQDLKGIVSTRGTNYNAAESQAQRLMAMIGVEQCGSANYFYIARTFGTPKPPTLDIAGFREQAWLDFSGGCPTGLANKDKYLAGLIDDNGVLEVQFNGEVLADIPMAGLAQKLMKYDYNDHLRRKVPFKEMVVNFENSKVKLRICFMEISAFGNGKELRMSSGKGYLMAVRKRGPALSAPGAAKGSADDEPEEGDED